MFVRKKKNRSGTTSIVVVIKRTGIYREITTIGTSKGPYEVESYFNKGKNGYPNIVGSKISLRFMIRL